MDTRTVVVETEGQPPEAYTVVRHMTDKDAATLHGLLDQVAAKFHELRGDAAPDHGSKFDQGIAMARSCIDELARDHTASRN